MSLIMALFPRVGDPIAIAALGSLRQIKSMRAARRLFLDITMRVELANIGPQIVDLLLVLDAGEGHFGVRYHGARALDVLLECRLVPDDAGVFIGVGIVEIRHRAGMAAVEAIELGADLVLRAGPDGMAGRAHIEDLLAFAGILSAG